MVQPDRDAVERPAADLDLAAGYHAPPGTPLGGYVVLVGVYNALFAAALLAARRRERRLAERPTLGDVLLLGVATHKLARLITKDWVTSPLRAPFTQYQEDAGAGELHEKARGAGMRRALGDLLTCPWCTGAWVAAAFGWGLALAPRVTRACAIVFAAETVADFLHLAYDRAKESRHGLEST
jgi:hypothetical protein